MECQRHRSRTVLATAKYIFGGSIQHEGNTNAEDVWWFRHLIGGEGIPQHDITQLGLPVEIHRDW